MSSSPATFRSPHCHRREIEVSSRFVMSPSKRTDGEKGCDQRLMYLCATDGRSPAVTALTAAATDKLLAIPLRRRRTSRLYLRIKRKRRNYFIAAPQDLSNRTSGERAARDGGDGDGGGEGSRTLNVTAGSTDRLEYNTVDLIICCIKLASVTCSWIMTRRRIIGQWSPTAVQCDRTVHNVQRCFPIRGKREQNSFSTILSRFCTFVSENVTAYFFRRIFPPAVEVM